MRLTLSGISFSSCGSDDSDWNIIVWVLFDNLDRTKKTSLFTALCMTLVCEVYV